MELSDENVFDKLNEVISDINGSLNILEEQIDIELQMEYFKFSKELKDENEKKTDLPFPDSNLLFDESISLSEKKEILVLLASVEDVEAFRAIEKYRNDPDGELKEWSVLALQESRMLIESSLLDENQVFISTGLGGRQDKLRYFVVLIHSEEQAFNDIQKKVVRSEFQYAFDDFGAELENIDFTEQFCTVLGLIPIEAPIKELFQKAIRDSNQFGDFIKENFIVTNVKKLNLSEIKDFLKKADEEEKTDQESEDYDEETD
jgi:hypothetical protein